MTVLITRRHFKNPVIDPKSGEKQFWAEFRNGFTQNIGGVELYYSTDDGSVDIYAMRTNGMNALRGGLSMPFEALAQMVDEIRLATSPASASSSEQPEVLPPMD